MSQGMNPLNGTTQRLGVVRLTVGSARQHPRVLGNHMNLVPEFADEARPARHTQQI